MMARVLLILVAAALAMGSLAQRSSQAIPAFARAHEFSCTTCHDPFPRLKDYGEEFAANGYQPSDQEMPPRYYTDVGDDRLSLLRLFPLAVRLELFADVSRGGERPNGSTDFKTPWGAKVLSGGRIADDIAYYFYFFMSEEGQIVGLEDCFVTFNNLFGSTLDLLVGQFQVSDPIFKRELRLTFQDYLPFKIRPGESLVDLTYDRGLVLSYDFAFGLTATASISNGTGIGGTVAESFDIDRYKNFLVRLSQELGPVRIGLTGFYAKEKRTLGEGVAARTGVNELNAWGPDLTLSLGRTQLNLLFLQRRDLNPDFQPANLKEASLSQGIMAEAITSLLGKPGRLIAVLLFNYIDSEVVGLRQEAYTANLTWLFRTNLKALAEYTFGRIVNGEERNEHRLTLGLVAAF